MKIPTIQQYKEAIRHVLLPRQITGLQILYKFPNATATAKELALKIHPAKPAPIIASGKIGRTGKRIADYCGIIPDNYFDGKVERPAYFTLIGEIYKKNVGWTMRPNLQKALEELNLVSEIDSEITERLPTETLPFEDEELFREGKVIKVCVNRYERNQSARITCIAHYGHKCQVCNFDFGKMYGEIADGFIHVHHKISLSGIGKEYKVDPIKDLIPVCANCHSVIHLSKIALTIEELKKLIKNASK